MPTYTVTNTKTNETYDISMKYSELEELLNNNKHLRREFRAPAIVSGVGGIKKDGGWTDMLKTIKKGSGAGNTIDV